MSATTGFFTDSLATQNFMKLIACLSVALITEQHGDPEQFP